MGSSFHWVDSNRGLPEFHRILQPGGHFTCLWNPRNIRDNEFHQGIEARIHEIVPNIKRVSSGAQKHTLDWNDVLPSTGHFEDVVFVEGLHEVHMTPDRYLGAWKSGNDIQVQAGPERWPKVLDAIAECIEGLETVVVPYRTRSWTARRRG